MLLRGGIELEPEQRHGRQVKGNRSSTESRSKEADEAWWALSVARGPTDHRC